MTTLFSGTEPLDVQSYDIYPGKLDITDQEVLGIELAHYINMKGFCVMHVGLKEEIFDECLDAAKSLDFRQPPEEIIHGFLGEEGSSKYCELKEADDKQGLGVLVQDMTYLIDSVTLALYPDVDLRTRSPAYLLKGGTKEVDGEEDADADLAEILTASTCSTWMNIFSRARLMVLVFLGPGEGTLELQPLNDEEAGMTEIVTKPNMMIILRCDALAHRHFCSEADHVMVSYALRTNISDTRGGARSQFKGIVSDTPVCKDLSKWAVEHMKQLMEVKTLSEIEDEVDRTWVNAMNHTWMVGNPAAVRGVGTHNAGAYDDELLWKTLNSGVDYATTIPYTRWAHEQYYDPDPDAYKRSNVFRGGGIQRTSIKHAQFIEGMELFDNKMFGISVMEAKGMDPNQRHVLETSYEALFAAGFKKKQLMLNYIAVFTGCTNPEFNYIDREAGACSGTGGSQAITSNRTSFILGMMGPSTSIDCEMASSGMALLLGATAVSPNHQHRTESGGDSTAATCGGVYCNLTPFMWPRFNFYMNPVGRCFTFDQFAGGYVSGECCNSVCLMPYAELVDGKRVINQDKCLSTTVGWRMTSNGAAASLTAPSGLAMKEAVADAIRQAGVHVLDIDAVDCHGIGKVLDDAAEVLALAQVLRYTEAGDQEPVILGGTKGNLTAQREASGMSQFIKVMNSIRFANIPTTLHLKEVSGDISLRLDDRALLFGTEPLSYKNRSAFHGLTNRGMGGTNTHIVQWYMADPDRVQEDKPFLDRQVFSFWPGGGGMIEHGMRPSRGYYIAGSWNHWVAEEMTKEAEDVFTCIVTMGLNNTESFQIWLDGMHDRVLYPSVPKAPSGVTVEGPSHMAGSLCWTIDGRTSYIDPGAPQDLALPDEGAVSTGEGEKDDGEHLAMAIPIATRDQGQPGDQYEVKLLVSGKFRTVTWDKISSVEEGAAITDPAVIGEYFITGTFNDWVLEKMSKVEKGKDYTWSATVGPRLTPNFEFVVVRNQDWEQTFYPPMMKANKSCTKVMGPDDQCQGMSWCVDEGMRETIEIEFHRPPEVDGVPKVFWCKVEE